MHLLIVEDNPDILANLLEFFQDKELHVETASDGLTGLHLAATRRFDLIILDVMLPGINGHDVCRRLRSSSAGDVPIIMLTARDALTDRLEGFNAGADDYVIKPFAMAELLARMHALLRRKAGSNLHRLRVADLTYDLGTLEVHRAEQRLKLNPTHMKLLDLLMRKSPGVVSRAELEKAVWNSAPPESDSLSSNIHLLRRAIDRPFPDKLLHTVYGVGYRLAEPT